MRGAAGPAPAGVRMEARGVREAPERGNLVGGRSTASDRLLLARPGRLLGSDPRTGAEGTSLETSPGAFEAAPPTEAIELDRLGGDLLRRRWRSVIGRHPPKTLSSALMVRILTWREQVLVVSATAEAAFAVAKGLVLFGPRSGSKTRYFSIPEELPPGPLQRLLRSRVIEVSSLRPGANIAIQGAVSGSAERWRELLDTRAETLATFADGTPAFIGNGNFFYLACWPDSGALAGVMRLICRKAGLSTIELPEGVRLRRRGDLIFAFNYGETSWPAPFGAEPLIGGASVAPRSFSVWRTSRTGRDQ